MAYGKKKKKEWWDRFDEWEVEWKKKRKEESLHDARKLRQAEEDYEKSLHSLNPLTTSPKPKKILATQSREPGIKRIPLESLLNCPLTMPARIEKIDQPNIGEAIIFFKTDKRNKGSEILEPVAFQIKRLMEYLINERFLFLLQPVEKDFFVIRVAGDINAPPLFNISLYAQEAILLRMLEKSLPWSPGYVFDVQEILKRIVDRFHKELEAQKED